MDEKPLFEKILDGSVTELDLKRSKRETAAAARAASAQKLALMEARLAFNKPSKILQFRPRQ